METALRRIADTLLAFVDDTVARYGNEVWWPSNWPGITWALIGVLLVLLWVASRRERRPRGLEVRPPQLLVTNGEVVPRASADRPSDDRPTAGRRRLDAVVHAASGTLAMTVSNLSRYPVQVLEVALRDEPRGAPRVVAVDAVVPAMGSVTVEGPVPLALRGDGWLDLYCYAAATRAKMHRHRVELVWEPWSARFKVAPLEQAVVAVRRLASDEPRARFLDDAVVGASAAPQLDDGTAAPAKGEPNEADRAGLAPPVAAAVDPAAPRAVPAPRAKPVARPTALPTAAGEPDARGDRADPAPSGPRTEAGTRETATEEPHGARDGRDPADAAAVPRIATPPVGVAVTGRGGSAARAPGGYPIGRPRAAAGTDPTSGREAPVADGPAIAAGPSAPGPAPVERQADDPGRDASTEAPTAAPTPAPARAPAPAAARETPLPDRVAAVPDDEVPEDEVPPPERAAPTPDAKPRRPRLEFPDEF